VDFVTVNALASIVVFLVLLLCVALGRRTGARELRDPVPTAEAG
jgi:hypothetical protein